MNNSIPLKYSYILIELYHPYLIYCTIIVLLGIELS